MSTRYTLARRAFLRGLGALGAASGLGWWLRAAESRAEGLLAPRRLLVLHRPNGTIRPEWLPKGGGPGATLGPILEPFAELAPHMVVLDGLSIVTTNGGDSTHEGGLVTLMTGSEIGAARPPSPDDWKNTAASVDQRLAAASPHLTGVPFASMQVAAHNRQEGAPEVANRALSYSGPDAPLYPEIKPSQTYERLFGGLTPGLDPAELARVRAKNKSVLDFLSADLARLDQLAPASERDKLEAHATAIRDLEKSLDGVSAGCTPGDAPQDPVDSDKHTEVAAVAEAQFAILRAALRCDVTRVLTFMWSPGASSVQFEGLYDGMGLFQHHALSHQNLGDELVAKNMAAIDRWYSERTAAFLKTLRDTPDVDGTSSLLDNTLVVYLSEVSAGNHTFDNLPLLLFGGAGVGLAGDRVVEYPGRSTNDLWLTIAGKFEVDLGQLGEPGQSTGPLPDLLA